MKYLIYTSLSYNPPTTSKTRPTSVAVTSDTLLFVLLASRAHAHDLLLVSVLVSEVKLKVSKNSTRTSLNMVQVTPEERACVIKTFYETNSLQQARVAFGLTNFA